MKVAVATVDCCFGSVGISVRSVGVVIELTNREHGGGTLVDETLCDASEMERIRAVPPSRACNDHVGIDPCRVRTDGSCWIARLDGGGDRSIRARREIIEHSPGCGAGAILAILINNSQRVQIGVKALREIERHLNRPLGALAPTGCDEYRLEHGAIYIISREVLRGFFRSLRESIRMDIDTVLVPIAGTDTSAHALEYAVALAEQYDAQIHALYVLDNGEAKARGEQLMVATRAAVGDVPLSYSSMYGFSTDHLTHHPGSVVLDVSDDIDADLIVIPRGRATGALGMAAEYVVQYASEPVLSV